MPWFKFYASDYQEDIKLRRCSLSARGLWMELMCIIDRYSEPYGFLSDENGAFKQSFIANKVMCSLPEIRKCMAELEQEKVFSRTPEGVIFSRRMVRDGKGRVVHNTEPDPDKSASSDLFDAENNASKYASLTRAESDSSFSKNKKLYTKKRDKELTEQQFLWFEEFWGFPYWRRVCRKAAEEAFAAKVKSPDIFGKVMNALASQSPDMTSREEKNIPHASSWLNGERWNDEIPTVRPKTAVLEMVRAVGGPHYREL